MNKYNSIAPFWKRIFIHTLLFLLIFFIPEKYFAQTIDLTNIDHTYNFSEYPYSFLHDPEGKLTVDQVDQIPTSQFVDIAQVSNDTARNLQYYWIKLEVKDLKSKERNWLLEVQSLHTPLVEFFYKNSAGKFVKKKAGHALPFDEKEAFKVKNIVFDLPGIDPEPQVYYIRIHSYFIRNFYFQLKTVEKFSWYNSNEYHLLGLYYGVLLIVAIYNLTLFFTTREKVFGFYVLYVLSCILTSYTEDGLGFQYIWSDYPTFNIWINYYVAPILFMLTFILYTRAFLELPERHPIFDRYLLMSLGFYFLFFIANYFISFSNIVGKIFYSLPFLLAFLYSLQILKKGYRPARFYVLAYTLIVISVFIQIFRAALFFKPSLFVIYSFNIGLFLEVCVMSFAIGDKFRILKDEKEQALTGLISELEKNKDLQEKVNRELEHKVQERTSELQTANEKMATLTQQLKDMNAKLDYDNWHLNRKITEDKKQFIVNKNISFEEFQKGFENELACQRYIESVKWPEGYVCRKCGNDKFSSLQKLLSRKCSKCNYIESVTTDTLYHGVRFPLVKAFYITYLVYNDIRDKNIESLMEELDLSKNTCWKFRKKVEERLINLKKQKKHTSSWNELIMD